jgi:hypothetical protein
MEQAMNTKFLFDLIRWIVELRRLGPTYLLASVLAALISVPSDAAYNANMAGVVIGVYTYADIDSIYIVLSNQPTTHPACLPNYFVIEGTVPADRRKAMLARLMTAYATKENVNIGYDAGGACAEGYIRVHRVG